MSRPLLPRGKSRDACGLFVGFSDDRRFFVPVLVLFVFFVLIMVRLLSNQGKDALAIVLQNRTATAARFRRTHPVITPALQPFDRRTGAALVCELASRAGMRCPSWSQAGSTTAPLGAGFAGADGDRLALRQKAVRRSHRLRHDNWVIMGARCGRNSFSSGTTSVLRAVFASRDEPMASAPALPEATVSGQFVQIFGRKENPRGGDVLVKVRHR